ncbi:MAG: 4Fe-4S dicluster domain-containing protein [Phycisphaerae bacterium]|nr:4Fe-4S dicluster domain-containing protein [Phycisphaerae bacterium]
MSKGMLIDTTMCIGCRACQVSCKRQNHLPAEGLDFHAECGGYQSPATMSGKTFSLVTFNEVEDDNGDFKWVFAKRQCMHCIDPACQSACIVGALHRDESGAVIYDKDKCIGCRYCMLACPFSVPKFEWEKTIPYIRKCTMCFERINNAEGCTELNDQPLEGDARERIEAGSRQPACVKGCPTGALKFGERDELLREAHQRIADNPGRYHDHVYGEHEAGGTSVMYLSSVPFEQLGFPSTERVGTLAYPSYTHVATKGVPYIVLGVGALLSGLYWLSDRRQKVAAAEAKREG